MNQIVWHRGDLRLHDHPALAGALSQGPVVPVVVLDSRIFESTSRRRRAWFISNVKQLRLEYQKHSVKLIVRSGIPESVIPKLLRDVNAQRVHAIRSYTPYGMYRDDQVEKQVNVAWYPGAYIVEPGSLCAKNANPYRTFKQYSESWYGKAVLEPLPLISSITSGIHEVEEGVLPEVATDCHLPDAGELSAQRKLHDFLESELSTYEVKRSQLCGQGSSRLSHYFSVGSLSARLAVNLALSRKRDKAKKWVSELIWRDFCADLLFHHPKMIHLPLDQKWEQMEWVEDQKLFERWKLGDTGFPVVDAAMRQLNETGYMSNRARMICAQFLTKLLLVPWKWGEDYFKHRLVDGDTSQNVCNWQWAAGLGVDNVPYFRVFNPILQGLEHDPAGDWLREWCPESDGDPNPLPNAVIDYGIARERYLSIAKSITM